MNETLKKLVSILLVVVMLLCAAPLSGLVGLELFGIRASAVEETDTTISGTIGTKLSWEIDKTSRELTIDNNGAMVSFASDDAPWRTYTAYFNSVIINEGCTKISQYAFNKCYNIISVDLPDTIEIIEQYAFYQCNSLENIDIPIGVTTIESWAFAYCTNLVKVVVGDNVEIMEGFVFYGCTSLSEVLLGRNLKEMWRGNFQGCTNLKSIILPDSIEMIGYDIFRGCSSLSEVKIGNGLDSINGFSFADCKNLRVIHIPYTCGYIAEQAFANCVNLTQIYIYNKYCSIDETAISIYSTIYGYTGSTAETFANTYGYNFVSIDTPCEHIYSNDCDTSCNICGETRETGAHSYGDWTITKEASCNKTGLKERTCSICGDVNKEIIEMLPHTDDDEDGICEVCKMQFEIKYPMHGVCGDNLTWELDDEGVLTIEGTGAMYDFNESNYIMISDGTGTGETTTAWATTGIYWPEVEATTARPTTTKAPTTAIDYPIYTTTTPNDDNISSPHITHPNGDNYYEGTTWKETTTRRAPTTKVPTTTKRAETTTARSEESTTVPSTTRPESTTAPATTKAARVAMYAPAQTTTTTYYGDTPTTVAQSFPNKEGYITIIRWNLHFDKIKKVVISEGVTSIGSYAFANCPQLSEIVISDSVTNIGYRAFINCTGLKEIEITKNIRTIGAYAFQGCSLLETLNFNAQNANSVYYNAFYNCPVKTLNIGPSVNNFPKVSSVETVAIAEGTAVVPYEAFSGCKYLTNVSLPNTLTTISENAFYNCTSLESINIPDSVTYIGRYAFQNCEGLTMITTPNSDCYIDYRAFYNCLNLTTVNYNTYSGSIYYNSFENCPVKTLNIGVGVNYIPKFYTVETVTFADGATIVPSYAFSKCINLKTINLPDTITHIYTQAFSGCDSLVKFEINENVVYIGENAFNNCGSLTEITIPESVEEIRSSAFGYCYNLTTLNFNAKDCYVTSNAFYQCPIKTLNVGVGVNNLPNLRTVENATFADGAKIVPDYTFSNCTELTSVTLPDSIESIGYRAFDYCSSLESIKLPKNLKKICERAFYACYNLKTADLPDSVERIERMAFDNCTSLKEIVLPDTVEYIGQYAFYGCTSVPSITIPENVSQIRYAAFGSCYALESVEFNATECDINSRDIFYGCNKISSVKIGSKVTVIPERFMNQKTNLTSVVIPSSVKEIRSSAFRGTSLTVIDIPNGVEMIGADAFESINTAKEINIPETVISIAPHAFANMLSIDKINFNAINANANNESYWYYSEIFANTGTEAKGITVVFGNKVETIPAFLFEVGSETAYPNIKNVIIGSSVKEIGDNAFYHCCAIENIDFGEGVETIGERAFDSCINVKELNLPESLKNISNGAFYSCNGLTEITIPENVEFIGINAFRRCSSLEKINYNATNCIVDYNNSQYAFDNCKSVKTVNIGNNVQVLPPYAFTGCSNLEKAYIPDIVINIDPLAFDGCGNVAIVCQNGSYANVYAVQNGIKYVLEDNVKGTAFEIRNSMLLGYSGSAQNVVLPSDINSVGIDAFKGSSVVKSIEVPYNVSKIYSGAFANCSKLERVIIPFTVTDISGSAFTGTNATIYCYYNSYAYNYAVANNIKYELITVTLSTNSVNIVETQSLSVDAVPSIVLASGIPLVWKSNNPAVASVDSTGKIVGNGVGATTIGVYDINGNMLDECSITVVEKAEIKLEDVSTDTLKYGEKIVLHINMSNLPEGASVKWTTTNGSILKISNENATCSNHTDCVTCTVESIGNGDAEIKATVVDKDGNPIIQNGEEISTSYKMKSKAGFFQKIIAFFKKLFGLLKTYPQTL